MKIAFLLIDRDTAYVFLDADNADPEAKPATLEIDGVPWSDIENEKIAVWTSNAACDKFRVVDVSDFDFQGDYEKTGYPIPTPIVILDKDEYDRQPE